MAASLQGQLLGTNPAEGGSARKRGDAFKTRAGGGAWDSGGEDGPRSLLRGTILPLSPLRYQEVQVAQKALSTAVAEALPEAERVLAAVQQAGSEAALQLTSSLAVSSALVSVAVLGSLHGVGAGEKVAAGKPAQPGQRQEPQLIFDSITVD